MVAVERAVVEDLRLRCLRAPEEVAVVLTRVGQQLLHIGIALRIAVPARDADLVDAEAEG